MNIRLRFHILIALAFVLVSCQKKNGDEAVNEGQATPTPPDYSLHCEENFTAIWCGLNREISSITEVCVGQLSLGNESIEAISLKTSNASKCYVSSGHSEDVTYSGCAVAKTNEYVGDLQGNEAMESIVCYAQGRPAYLDGSSPSGELFRTFHIE